MCIRKRIDIIAWDFIQDYDMHHKRARQLCLRINQVAKEYRYHKQVVEHMIDTAN